MINGTSVLAIVPARGGSKGVPGKNVLPIGGRPLIQWTIDAAHASRYIDRLVLSSDDTTIMAAARAADCEVPFRRDPSLAEDSSTTVDVVLDALDRLPGYSIVLVLQPTSPLRITADIDGVLERLISTGAPACVSVREAEDHPYWTFSLDEHRMLRPFALPDGTLPLRRQDLPKAWCLNGAVYAARIEWFREHRTFISPQTAGYAMPNERSIDIDTFDDVERLRSMTALTHPASTAHIYADPSKVQS